MISISVKNINKTYNKKTKALNDLCFNVEQNKIIGFIGCNGAGKTTTIDILAGILKPNSGEIKIFGDTINVGDWQYKAKVGFVMEKPNYLENLTGKEYLKFASIMHKINKNEAEIRVNELLDYFELPISGKKLIKEYSKGMKKKLSLSCALVHNPELLIMDEPFEGLDPVSRKKAKDILLQIRNNGKTIFISSHSLLEVEDFCDEVAIINKGQIIFQSATKDIRNKIKNKLTQETYQSLEEIFIDLTAEKEDKKKMLSWL